MVFVNIYQIRVDIMLKIMHSFVVSHCGQFSAISWQLACANPSSYVCYLACVSAGSLCSIVYVLCCTAA